MISCLLSCLLAFAPGDVVIDRVLVLPASGPGVRAPFRADPVQWSLANGEWRTPLEGETLGANAWREASGKEGVFEGRSFSGGYSYATFESETESVMMLEAAGHVALSFNGEPRAGDPYGYGYVRLPVKVRKGMNEILAQNGRGRLSLKLTQARGRAFLDTADATLPDLVQGSGDPVVGGLVGVNATEQWQRGLHVSVACEGAVSRTELPAVPPLTVRKVPVSFTPPAGLAGESVEYTLTLTSASDQDVRDEVKVRLRVRTPRQTRKVTFISGIDGSVQYYALNPAFGEGKPAGLVLSLHGASVEATSQADAYRAKPELHIVCPTNRRPFGFDWEDWGRLDALEVLSHATEWLKPDPARVYLTGHSMGGHGTWNFGVLFPDRFAAIAPSAGWVSFWSYTGAQEYDNPAPMEKVFRRAVTPSDTLKMSRNYLHHGVYILHGDADDNVPVGQARLMRRHLSEFHPDFAYYERPGAGHWWGNECVDWPPIFEFFTRRQRQDSDSVEFITPNVGVSSDCRWVSVRQQQVQNEYSVVKIDLDRAKRTFTARELTNVALLHLDRSMLEGPGAVYFTHDGQTIDITAEGDGRVALRRTGQGWTLEPVRTDDQKGPERTGPFKHVFNRRAVLVYGTGGDDADRAWAFNKARFDAETFWYRGNGAFEIVPDTEYDPARFAGRNVVLYGNADTNHAWKALLSHAPVQAWRGLVRVGEREMAGEDLVAMFVYRYPGSSTTLVGAVAPTGPAGRTAAERVGYFTSGVGYPDWTVFSSRVLRDGLDGVRAAGWFGNQWNLDEDQSVFAE
jgi:pimeloyl-ACP methyl ester carboxylesterase